MSATHPLSSAVIGPTAAQAIENAPPITQIVPFLSKTASFLVATSSQLSFALVFLTSWLSYAIFLLAKAPLPLILYILSPFIVFGQIVVGVFFVIPYHAVVDFFVAVQPFYVFCGVACISGVLIGLCGRVFAGAVSAVIVGHEKMESISIEQSSLDEKPKKRMVS